MSEPTVRKVYVQEARKTPHSPHLPISLLSFFTVYQTIFGFNFGCTKLINDKFKNIVHCISVAMACFMMSTLSLTIFVNIDYRNGHYWKLISFVQYVPAFFILISTKYSICEVLSDLIVTHKPNKISLILWVYTLLMFALKMTGAMMYCALTTCTDSYKMFLQFLLNFPMLALDVLPVVSALLFYHIYIRMRDLRIQLARCEITYEGLETAYKEIVNNVDKFKVGYDAMFIWEFLTDSPKLMLVVWNHLHSLKTYNSWLMYASTSVYAIHATMQICIPAVCAEMVNAQVDEIKMILHERLSEKEEATCARLLRYVCARAPLRAAWRVLPLDLRLPTAMLSLCSTYLIVIVQYTHLYD